MPSIEVLFTVEIPLLVEDAKMKSISILQSGYFLSKNEVALLDLKNPVFRSISPKILVNENSQRGSDTLFGSSTTVAKLELDNYFNVDKESCDWHFDIGKDDID